MDYYFDYKHIDKKNNNYIFKKKNLVGISKKSNFID